MAQRVRDTVPPAARLQTPSWAIRAAPAVVPALLMLVVGGYRLRHPALVRLSAQIMACEAQHWTVLSGLRNPGQYVKAIPWPYVYGSK